MLLSSSLLSDISSAISRIILIPELYLFRRRCVLRARKTVLEQRSVTRNSEAPRSEGKIPIRDR